MPVEFEEVTPPTCADAANIQVRELISKVDILYEPSTFIGSTINEEQEAIAPAVYAEFNCIWSGISSEITASAVSIDEVFHKLRDEVLLSLLSALALQNAPYGSGEGHRPFNKCMYFPSLFFSPFSSLHCRPAVVNAHFPAFFDTSTSR